jgi:hypothetical protein
MKMDLKLIESKELADIHFDSPLSNTSIRGTYNSMQFVVRLREDIHLELKNMDIGIYEGEKLTDLQIQAFSTYLHETIHWWQHVGSFFGMTMSLTFPAQAHLAVTDLKELLKKNQNFKSIKSLNQRMSKTTGEQGDDNVNKILNNWFDIHFAELITNDPQRHVQNIVDNPYFESVGHSYHILWSSCIQALASIVDPTFKFLPDVKEWSDKFKSLTDSGTPGFFYGSPVGIPPFGTKAIFEGQARFSQLQYLFFGLGKKIDYKDFKKQGLISGLYGEAFYFFLDQIEENEPETIDSPIIGLFLLVCDISINSPEAFPLNAIHFESFIISNDPGTRFMLLCQAIKEKHPELKYAITNYSKEEYIKTSEILSNAIVSFSPYLGSELISHWITKESSIIELLKEESSFQYMPEDLPIRLFFSKFLRYQEDKFKHPHFFCWSGIYFTNQKNTNLDLGKVGELFNKHQALFIDDVDGDIYPVAFPNYEERNIDDTFNTFFRWNSAYDLIRQWVINDGSFSYNYCWLTSKYSLEEMKMWATEGFFEIFGIDPEELIVLDDN